MAKVATKKRVLSGVRPTGRLHWGNYFGALRSWVELQGEHECFFFVADWHALTTGYDRAEEIRPAATEVLKDWLSAGLDPSRATIFIQSLVPEHAELHLLLSMITPLGWLERVPSFKEMQLQMPDRDLSMYGFLGYPLLQAADILIYRADLVPVGEDQVAHIEFTREVVRRFGFLTKRALLVEPQPLLTRAARVPGTDGRKMSKGFGNAIYMSDDDETIRRKMMETVTDPARKLRKDPGTPEVCNIFAYHRLYSGDEKVAWIADQCRTAGIGCVECKGICIENATAFWRPIREQRRKWDGREAELLKMAADGSRAARAVAGRTMESVREAFGLKYI